MVPASRAAAVIGVGPAACPVGPGRAADLVVLRGDPERSIGESGQVELVLREGRMVWPHPPR